MFYGSLTGFGSGGEAAPFVPLGVQFDGTNDYMRHTSGSPMTGAVDSKLFTCSFWMNTNSGTDGQRMDFYVGISSTAIRPFQHRSAQNTWYFAALRVGATTPEVQAFATNSDQILAASGWQHCIISIDAASARAMYINDTLQADNNTQDADEEMDLTPTTSTTIGSAYTGAHKTDADLAEFWVLHGTALDLSVTANRRKFYSATGDPVDLGADGSTPTGAVPVQYYSVRSGDAASDFATNRGQGSNMTITGSLTLSSTNPGD